MATKNQADPHDKTKAVSAWSQAAQADPHDYKLCGVKLEQEDVGEACCRKHGMSRAIMIKSGPNSGYEVCAKCFWEAVLRVS